MTDEDRAIPGPRIALIVVALSGAFVVLAIVVGTGASARIDSWIAERTRFPDSTVGNDLAQAINQASGVGVAILAAAAGLVLAVVRRNWSWLILLAPLATVPVELLGKNVIPRTMFDNTPYIELGPFLTIATPYTFPSGNMARVAALVLALLLHSARPAVAEFGTTAGMSALVISGVVLAVTAWSHLAIGDHWPSDVLGGLLLGAATAYALAWFLERHEARTPSAG